MTISIGTEKAFEKSQHAFTIKSFTQTRNKTISMVGTRGGKTLVTQAEGPEFELAPTPKLGAVMQACNPSIRSSSGRGVETDP